MDYYDKNKSIYMYQYIRKNDRASFEEHFPKLIKYEDKIFRIVNAVVTPLNLEHSINFLIEETVNLVTKMDGYDYEISDDLLTFVGEEQRDYMMVSKIDVFLDFNHNIYDHIKKLIYYFGLAITKRIKNPLPNNVVLKDESLEKLSQITRLIHYNYADIYDKDYLVIDLLILYGYYHNDDYSLLYNFLNNYSYYIDKLISNGLIGTNEIDTLQINDDLESLYNNLESFFCSYKACIM